MYRWTTEDDIYLRSNYSSSTLADFAKHFGISETAVLRRCKKLDLQKRETVQVSVDLPGEEWREICDFPGYFVSNMGNLSHVVGKGKVRRRLKSWVGVHGYSQTLLTTPSSQKVNKRVHRLVAEAFIPNPSGKEHVNHIDGVKTNNLVENLEWASASENQLHAFQTGLQTAPSSSENVLRKVPIATVEHICQLIVDGRSTSEIKELTNVCEFIDSPNALISRIRLKESFLDVSRKYF